MSRFRRNLWLSSLGGLLAGGLLATIAVALVVTGTVTPLLSFWAVTMLFVLILGGFSLAEIPMMIFALRRLAIERPGNKGVVMGLNALYVSFAAVYGVPVLLITGNIEGGLALCALGIVRFVTSLVYVREPSS